MTDSPAGLVLTGCTVLVHDDRERIGFEENAVVVVRGGLVDVVTTAAAVERLPAAERIDARGRVAMPGLINCRTHAPMAALHGVAEDLPIEEWFNDVVWPVESNLTGKGVELGARPACAEMIRGGVT
jgi:5-methylthioadenosine/S-adenosylhomocysteine deaminase